MIKKSIFWENFKKNSFIILLTLILYFYHITLFNSEDYLLTPSEGGLLLSSQSLFISVLGIILGILANRRFYSKKTSSFYHSLPITDREYCVSEILSSLCIIVLSIIGTVLEIYFLVSTKQRTLIHWGTFILEMGQQFLLAFSIAYLAGKISGNKVIQTLISIFILDLPLSLRIIYQFCIDIFFEGNGMELTSFWTINTQTIYLRIIISIVFLVFSVFLSSRIKREKIGDNVFFPLAGDLLTYIVTLIASLIISLIFNDNLLAPIVFITLTISFIICRMLSEGTLSVFHKSNISKYIISIVTVVLTVALMSWSGHLYISRLPELSEVSQVSFHDIESEEDIHSKDPHFIKKVYRLHQYMATHRDVKSDDYNTNIVFDYQLNNKHFTRTFTIYTEYYKDKKFNQLIDSITHDKIYIQQSQINTQGLDTLEIAFDFNDEESSSISLKEDEIKTFVTLYNQDILKSPRRELTREGGYEYAIKCHYGKKSKLYYIYQSDSQAYQYIKKHYPKL